MPIADIADGSWPAALQILAALLARQNTNRGCWIDVAMTAFTSSLMFLKRSREISSSTNHAFADPLHGDQPYYSVYATQNGHIAVAALEHKFWKALITTLELPHLIDLNFASGNESIEAKQELKNVFFQKTTEAWMSLLAPIDACVEPVLSISKMISETRRRQR